MSSPGRDTSVMSSSPESVSPVHRRPSVSLSDASDSTARLRHSPTLSRSYDPNDPQVRERQRTMDVDMAMHLSRARRDTISVALSPDYDKQGLPSSLPAPSPVTPTAQDLDASFPILVQDTIEEEPSSIPPSQPASPSLVDFSHDNLQRSQEPPRLATHISEGPHAGETGHEGFALPSSSIFPPTYQVNPPPPAVPEFPPGQNRVSSLYHFDFAPMEEFAAAEKTKLGLAAAAATPRFSISALRGAARRPVTVPTLVPPLASSSATQLTESPSEDVGAASQPQFPEARQDRRPSAEQQQGAVEPSTHEPPPSPSILATLRQRKLSQSNPHPRSHRKGIGGKMALFEAQLLDASGVSGAGGTYPSRVSYAVTGHAGAPYDGISAGGILHSAGHYSGHHDRPYRFSFYSNSLGATIHARSISELPAEGQTFEDLFTGNHHEAKKDNPAVPTGADSTPASKKPSSLLTSSRPSTAATMASAATTASAIPGKIAPDQKTDFMGKANSNYGNNGGDGIPGIPGFPNDENTWWLDVQSPTDEEMKMLSRVFNIHPLTTEDIQMEETREKIELFKNYYFVCFRSFEQDQYSPTYLEPLNMYIIVFREGILSFHFRPTPHPQNVRRRIKQLKDYISVTSDWISYALIDDITDAFGPLIQGIEYEVDSIDELVLILKETEQSDMLRRIGTCRKKVVGLLRLMGNKADVVKGLAKRCNENWRMAPTSDIGLYLSDIQDHLITMTQNLNHYEKILSRSHSNYLAQISIEMTDANNQINDVLSKLTALGTILIPMNLITGLWGMNVHVPGQDVPGYAWFISIIACLAAFAVIGGFLTYKLMVRR